jgi:drug/metabolite transporter (DMT)-like permease
MSETNDLGNAIEARKGLIFVFMAGVLWSTVGLGIRLIEEATVWQILLYRSISLSIFLAMVIYLRSHGNFLKVVKAAGLPGCIAGLALVGAYSGGIYGIQSTSVANAMLLFAAAPFMAAMLGWIFLRERVRKATWVAILFAIVGIGIMVQDKTQSGAALLGNLAALGGAFGFAVFSVALRWGRSGDMLPAVFLSGIFAIFITSTICFFNGLSFRISVNDTSISMGMGVFQVGAGLVLYTLGSKTIPAAELTLLSLAEVLLGPLWVYFFLNEVATLNTLLGGLVLLLAIAGNAISGARKKPPPITAP